jgi:hypothetical protein
LLGNLTRSEGLRLEHEDLDREVRVEVVVAHEADHLASGELLALAAEVGLHDALPADAQVATSPSALGRPVSRR